MSPDETRKETLREIDAVLNSPKILFLPEKGRRMLHAQRLYWEAADTAALQALAALLGPRAVVPADDR